MNPRSLAIDKIGPKRRAMLVGSRYVLAEDWELNTYKHYYGKRMVAILHSDLRDATDRSVYNLLKVECTAIYEAEKLKAQIAEFNNAAFDYNEDDEEAPVEI